jgi:hypothetical protein
VRALRRSARPRRVLDELIPDGSKEQRVGTGNRLSGHGMSLVVPVEALVTK